MVLAAVGAAASMAADNTTRIGHLPLGDMWVPADLRIAIVAPDWKEVVYLDSAAGLQAATRPDGRHWRVQLPPGTLGGGALLEQSVRRVGDDLAVDISVSNLGTQALAGVFLMLNVPAPDFAGGSFRIDETRGDLPLVPGEPHLRIREGSQCTLWNADGTRGVSLGSDTLLRLLVQDGRRWGPEFSVLATLHAGTPPPDRILRRSIVLSALGAPRPPAPPGALTIDPARRMGAFEGFGGNFCFGLDDPVTEQVRRRLRPRVARIRLHLDDLRPPPAGSRDPHADWMRMLSAADRPWSELWQSLGLAATLHRDGTRLQISTWRVPAWILAHSPKHDQNRIAPEHYDDLAGMIAAYLDYLRRSRGVVPETFSFNEPDWGANVIFTPEEHRDALLAVNQALLRRGLETRLMLGDISTAARASTEYLAPVLTNSVLMARAAGISFHAWDAAEEADYAAWRALAEQTGLPLIVGEIGADPHWREVQLHGYNYALREMALYLDVLRQARPRQVLYWEYGSSYALLPPETLRERHPESERLALQQHLSAFTPPGSEAIACQSPIKAVAAAAFAFPRDDHEGYTLHVANFGAQTTLAIAGFPSSIRRLNVIETSQGVFFRARRAVPLASGAARVTLPALSLTTFTTR